MISGRLTILTVTYNSASVLPGLLDALPAALAGVDLCRIVVADNDSRDASVALAQSHHLRPQLHHMGRNAGYAAAINGASERFGVDGPLLILNPDTRPQPRSISRLLTCLSRTGAGVAAPRLISEDGKTMRSLRREPSLATAVSEALLGGRLSALLGSGEVIGTGRHYDGHQPVLAASGAALLIAQAARHHVGAWDESYFLYSEEVDYLRRVREAGYSVRYVPEAVVVHRGGESNVNPRLFALLTANRIRYFRRHHGRPASLAFMAMVMAGEALRLPRGPTHRAALAAAWHEALSAVLHRPQQQLYPLGPAASE